MLWKRMTARILERARKNPQALAGRFAAAAAIQRPARMYLKEKENFDFSD